MRDFTLKIFRELCMAFVHNAYEFITFSDYCTQARPPRFVIMRHDVDTCPGRAVTMAQCEKTMNITATYYFRSQKPSYNAGIIAKIAGMGHEIGYHYEDLVRAKGDHEKAISSFKENIERIRLISDVQTICMHGSPFAKWDNRMLWHRYEYRDLGVIGEPYLDVDFDEVLYLTDTSRRWNGVDTNVRDTVKSKYRHNMKSTVDVIAALSADALPCRIMMNAHPQRWSDGILPWVKELLWQNIKNAGKRSFLKRHRDLSGT